MQLHKSTQIDDQSGLLAERLRQRDPSTVADLYDLYGRTIYVLIVRIVRNPAVAEDLVQEAFLRAWNRSDQLGANYTAVGPWLVAIARHCALDYLKSSQAHFSAQAATEESEFPAVTMEPSIFSTDRTRVIEDSFQVLSDNQRMVIQLSFYEGLSHGQIAKRLDQPLGTVKGWARSALARLRRQLDPQMIDFAANY